MGKKKSRLKLLAVSPLMDDIYTIYYEDRGKKTYEVVSESGLAVALQGDIKPELRELYEFFQQNIEWLKSESLKQDKEAKDAEQADSADLGERAAEN